MQTADDLLVMTSTLILNCNPSQTLYESCFYRFNAIMYYNAVILHVVLDWIKHEEDYPFALVEKEVHPFSEAHQLECRLVESDHLGIRIATSGAVE